MQRLWYYSSSLVLTFIIFAASVAMEMITPFLGCIRYFVIIVSTDFIVDYTTILLNN
jgi:hypothetical protein